MEEGQFVTFATEICGSGTSDKNNPAKLNRVTRDKKQRAYCARFYRFASAEHNRSRPSTQLQIAEAPPLRQLSGPLGYSNAPVQIAGRNAAGLLAATRAGIFSSARQLVESTEQK
jgi:hypothetical protein